MKRPWPRQTIATPDECARLIEHAEPWLRLFILLCSGLGLRFREALRLCPADYNQDTHTITFTKKGSEQHTLPITPPIAALLELAPRTDDPTTPFLQLLRGDQRLRRRDARMSDDTLRHAWESLKKETHVNPQLRPHDLRRTIAVAFHELTHDIVAVSRLLGHRSISSTAEYLLHRDPEKLRVFLSNPNLFKPATEVKQ